ncbi:MAG: hypothetical protein EB003_05390, partial [Flavobacteriia bacterium]|nr:hypothetical protein [Flavobacteriia bacterium]
MPKPSSVEIATLPNWAQLMYSEQPNVQMVQNAYQDYYRNQPFVKNYHTQYYKRWIRQNQYFVNTDGFVVQLSAQEQQKQTQAYLNKQEMQTKTSNWSVVGPITNYQQGLTQGSGQTNVYSFDQCAGQPNTCYCGTEPGEVFKSVDGGQNWTCISMGLDFSSGVTAVEVSPTNPLVFFAGGNNGVYRSL